jgi:hypothetical protein
MKKTSHLRLQAFAAIAVGLVAASMLSLDREDTTRIAGRLGPTPGPNSMGHVQAKQSYLQRIARADPEKQGAALASFDRFVAAPNVTRMVAGLKTTVVFVVFPESEPEAIALSRSLTETMTTRAKELGDVVRAEIVSLEGQLRDAQGAEREALADSLARRRQALNGLNADCTCIYAIGLEEATLAQLAALQGRDEVLLVDVPSPVTASLDGWHLTPILPGQAS